MILFSLSIRYSILLILLYLIIRGDYVVLYRIMGYNAVLCGIILYSAVLSGIIPNVSVLYNNIPRITTVILRNRAGAK